MIQSQATFLVTSPPPTPRLSRAAARSLQSGDRLTESSLTLLFCIRLAPLAFFLFFYGIKASAVEGFMVSHPLPPPTPPPALPESSLFFC